MVNKFDKLSNLQAHSAGAYYGFCLPEVIETPGHSANPSQGLIPNFPCFQDRSNPGIPSEREAVSTYCRQRGLDLASVLKHWNFYLALSFFRIASIAQVWADACLS